MSQDDRPSVSVLVPCRNEADDIEACLRSILAQENPPGRGGFEVIVADGLSTDETCDRVRDLTNTDPRVRLIENTGRIVSTGLNAAIAVARGDVILRMDAHTTYAADYLRQCVVVLEETGADNVGGPWVAQGDSYLSRAIGAAFRSPFGAGHARAHDRNYEGPLDTVYLGCWRRALFDRIGLFDEGLVRNQDDEFNLRLTLAGGQIWQSPRIKSWYRPRASLGSLFRQYFQYGYWKVRVIQKHRRPASLRHLVPVLFVFGLSLGWLAGFLHWSLWVVYAGSLACYAMLSVAAAVQASAQAGWELFLVLPLVFLAYHISYGCGFALGLLDFIILRRGFRRTMTVLTRPSQADRSTRSSAP